MVTTKFASVTILCLILLSGLDASPERISCRDAPCPEGYTCYSVACFRAPCPEAGQWCRNDSTSYR